jgi:PAS domain S-box-containing protein
MQLPLDEALGRRLRRLAQAGAAVAAAVGGVVLLGWALGRPVLADLLPGLETMKANTAACFVLVGIGLWTVVRRDTPANRSLLAIVCGAVVAAVGGATLIEYVTGRDLGIDQVLFAEPGEIVHPGRMARSTAVSLLALGLALTFAGMRSGRLERGRQALALLASAIGLIVLVGYVYGTVEARAGFTPMAVHTAATLFVVAASALFTQCDRGLPRVIASRSYAGAVLRRLLPVLVAVPLGLGLVVIAGSRARLYEFDLALPLFTVLVMVALIGLAWRSAAAIAAAEAAESAQREWFRVTLASVGDGVVATNAAGEVRFLNPAAETLTGWPASAAVGRAVDEVFRIVDEGTGAPRRSPVESALAGEAATLVEDSLLVQRSGARLPVADSAAPIGASDGELLGAVLVFRDVSERRAQLRALEQTEVRLREALAQAELAEETIRASEQHLRNVLNSLFAFVGVMTPDGVLIEANRAALAAAALAPGDVLGKPFDETYWWSWSPDVQGQLRAAIVKAARGESSRYDVRIRLSADRYMTIDFMLVPMRDPSGRITHLIPSAIDITDRIRAEEQRQLVQNELNHRVKNLLAIVSSIAAQTAQGCASIAQFEESFLPRLRSLARTHAVLTKGDWQGTDLRTLVDEALAPYGGPQAGVVRCDGPRVEVDADAAIALTLVLHELATNAAKYGALSQAGGAIDLSWSVGDDPPGPSLRLGWVERGGPVVAPSGRTGFGSRLIDQSVSYQLDGTVDLQWPPEGLRCELTIPLERLGRRRREQEVTR